MKIINFLFLILLLAQVNFLHAHAVVTHSSLTVNAIAPNQATQVELQFNSRIEIKLSQIFLVSAGDIKQHVKVRSGKKPGQLYINLPPLKQGEYALQLKIFATDGHFSEDLIHFVVTEKN